MTEFEGRVAVVAGAASGVGRATTLALANAGTRVVLADIDVEEGEKTLAMVHEAGRGRRGADTPSPKGRGPGWS